MIYNSKPLFKNKSNIYNNNIHNNYNINYTENTHNNNNNIINNNNNIHSNNNLYYPINNNKLLNILQSSLIPNNFNYSKNNNYLNNQISKIATHIIKTFFDNKFPNLIISNPTFDNSTNKINISIFYYSNDTNNLTKNYYNKNNYNNIDNFKDNHKSFKIIQNDSILPLSDTISILFNKQVNFNLIRIHYPYINSFILAQYLIKNASTNTFLHFSEAILSYPSLSTDTYGIIGQPGSFTLPSYITSIRLQLAGRLITEQVVPRLTKKSIRISNPNTNNQSALNEAGIHSHSINNTITDYAKYSSKNELGSFTLKVWINSIITQPKLILDYYSNLFFNNPNNPLYLLLL
uniref:ribosomal protein S3 n=1 Tax=Malassezia vespertilionis TaxID=2020962 RepID=UPI003002836C|nr:ribosomal protein S3 [Malassezia vespertilionis]